MRDCGCQGLHDARRMSAALGRGATPGDGLPSIEPGMPMPAGTGLDRRSFLSRSAGVALSVYGASKLGLDALDEGIAAAAAPDDPILVSIFLEGGVDQLSMLAPVGDAGYATRRPLLQLPANGAHALAGHSSLQWHPKLVSTGVKQLHEEGKVVVFPSIGYQHDNQSHFTSRHFWEVGAVDMNLNTGWLGRYLDAHGTLDTPLQGLSIAQSLAPQLAAGSVPVSAMVNPRDYQLNAFGVSDPGIAQEMYRTIGELGTPNNGDFFLEQARRVSRATATLRGQLARFADPEGNTYTADFPSKLAMLADMIAAGLPLKCVALNPSYGGGSYDTHSTQYTFLPDLLDFTFQAIVDFQRALESRGLADRVVIHVWSEFGRRVRENGTEQARAGTDHGAAGFGMLIGSRVKGYDGSADSGMVGEWPGFGAGGVDAYENQKYTVEFQPVYAALIDQWLGGDPAKVIAGADAMTLPQLIR